MSGASSLLASRKSEYFRIRDKAAQPDAIDPGAAEQIEKANELRVELIDLAQHELASHQCLLPSQDLRRTFPTHSLWTVDPSSEKGESQGVQLLRNVLRAYAYFDKEVMYCQVKSYSSRIRSTARVIEKA